MRHREVRDLTLVSSEYELVMTSLQLAHGVTQIGEVTLTSQTMNSYSIESLLGQGVLTG